MIKYLLVALLMVSFVLGSASETTTKDFNIDYLVSLCNSDAAVSASLSAVCSSYGLIVESSNVLSESEANSLIDGANTPASSEISVLERSLSDSKTRLVFSWNSLLSIFVLLLEIIKTVYYLLLIALLVHLPYFYVKLMVYLQRMVVKKWR